SLSLAAARPLALSYGVELVALEPLSAGSVNSNFRARTNDGRLLFARLYEEQGLEGAEIELALLRDLAAAGSPVALPLRPAGALPLFAGKPFALFPWVPGEILCLARVDARSCE